MLIKEGKTNIKYLLVVVILATVVGGGTLWCASKQEVPLAEFPEIKIPKDETADWKTYRNEEYGFELSCPGDLTVREWQPGDIESFIVGFIEKGAQAHLVSIEKYNKLEDFSNLIAIKKYYKRNDYYLVILGFLENTLADQIVSTFKFTE